MSAMKDILFEIQTDIYESILTREDIVLKYSQFSLTPEDLDLIAEEMFDDSLE